MVLQALLSQQALSDEGAFGDPGPQTSGLDSLCLLLPNPFNLRAVIINVLDVMSAYTARVGAPPGIANLG